MSHSSTNDKRSASETAKTTGAWVRAKRAPRRKRTDCASKLQLGVINLASNRHA